MDDMHKLAAYGLHATKVGLGSDDNTILQLFWVNDTLSTGDAVAMLTAWFGNGGGGDGKRDVKRLQVIASSFPHTVLLILTICR
jgi:hypothetical protein